MSTKLSPYTPPPPLRSSLIKNVTDAIPPIDELEQLQAELKDLKQRALENVKKAGEELKTIEKSIRRMEEKEKGKARAIDKIKRERDYTPVLDSDDSRSTSTYSVSSKHRVAPHLLRAIPASSRSFVDPRKLSTDDLKKRKKKRKRDDEESEAESEIARPRKSTPPAALLPPPQKSGKSTPMSSQAHTKPAAGPDFTLPQSSAYQSLCMTRPPILSPPTPGPSKPTDVMDDFSKLKVPAQIQATSFYASIEPWLRPIHEEDIGFLEYTGDEVDPFIMPKLGRHYLEVWEEEDAGLVAPLMGFAQEAPPEQFMAPTPRWDPSTLMEPDLLVEEKGHGPLTERVISALLHVDSAVWKGVKAAEDAMEGRPGGSGAAAARKERLNVSELENRIKDTMRYHGLLEGMPDFTEKVDDPIAAALRQAQQELRTVLAVNKERRARLVAIARDRLAYQEYLELRDSIDKNISTLFGKLQKKDGPKIGRKKKKIVGAAAAAHAAAVAAQAQTSAGHTEGTGPSNNAIGSGNGAGTEGLLTLPAALGLGPDEENRLVVNEQLSKLVETRRQWVNTVGKIFEEKQRTNTGRIWDLPTESVFKDMEEEVRQNLERIDKGAREEEERRRRVMAEATANAAATAEVEGTHSKGKEREDEMDVG